MSVRKGSSQGSGQQATIYMLCWGIRSIMAMNGGSELYQETL